MKDIDFDLLEDFKNSIDQITFRFADNHDTQSFEVRKRGGSYVCDLLYPTGASRRIPTFRTLDEAVSYIETVLGENHVGPVERMLTLGSTHILILMEGDDKYMIYITHRMPSPANFKLLHQDQEPMTFEQAYDDAFLVYKNAKKATPAPNV